MAAAAKANTASIRLRQSYFVFIVSRAAHQKCLGELELNGKCLTCGCDGEIYSYETDVRIPSIALCHSIHPNRAIS